MSSAATRESKPLAQGLDPAAITALLSERFAGTVDPANRWSLTVIIARDKLRDALRFLRDEPTLAFDQLLDVAGIDYLSYPGWRGARFAVVYLFKSTSLKHRVAIKVLVEEDDAAVPSVHDLWKIADWAERETWDQFGIDFTGHPNLKRLLNHHEFVGHPLRKDYPCQKRQKLSVNDAMADQLAARLNARGFTILEASEQPAATHISGAHGGTP